MDTTPPPEAPSIESFIESKKGNSGGESVRACVYCMDMYVYVRVYCICMRARVNLGRGEYG